MIGTDVGPLHVGTPTTRLGAAHDTAALGMRTVHAVPPYAVGDGTGRVLAVCGRPVFPEDDSWPPSGSRPDVRACHDCAARLLDPGPVPWPR